MRITYVLGNSIYEKICTGVPLKFLDPIYIIFCSGPRMMVTPGQPPQQRPPMRPPVSQQQRMPAMSQAPGSIPQQIVNPAQARMQSPMMGNPGQNPNLMSQQQQMVSQHNPVSSQYQVSLISEFQKNCVYDFT